MGRTVSCTLSTEQHIRMIRIVFGMLLLVATRMAYTVGHRPHHERTNSYANAGASSYGGGFGTGSSTYANTGSGSYGFGGNNHAFANAGSSSSGYGGDSYANAGVSSHSFRSDFW